VAKFFIDGVIDSGTGWLVEPDSEGDGREAFCPDVDRYRRAVRYFSERYPHLDWLINFPFHGTVRYIKGSGGEKATKLLAHANPAELLTESTGRTYGPALSLYYKRLLESLGHTCRYETIFLDGNNVPFYDLFLATKDKSGRAVAFFEKACGIKASGQRTLDLWAS